MHEIIKVNYETEQATVSARDLYELLGLEERFSKWFERMVGYGFEMGKEYSNPYQNERVQIEGTREVAREVEDYDLTIDMAKEICMLQRTEKGKQCRQYFLELEKAWNTPEQIFARALKMADSTIGNLKDRCTFLGGQIEEQQKLIERMQPKASYYDLILQCPDLISATIIAKDYGMSAKGFNKMLHDMGVIYRQSEVWVMYAKYQGYGYAQTKTQNYPKPDGTQGSKQHMYWTQKGRLFLYEFLKNKGTVPSIEKDEERIA